MPDARVCAPRACRRADEKLFYYLGVFYDWAPKKLLTAIFGATLCFFGGTYVATLAAIEAFRTMGGERLWDDLQYVYSEAKKVNAANVKDEAGTSTAELLEQNRHAEVAQKKVRPSEPRPPIQPSEPRSPTHPQSRAHPHSPQSRAHPAHAQQSRANSRCAAALGAPWPHDSRAALAHRVCACAAAGLPRDDDRARRSRTLIN